MYTCVHVVHSLKMCHHLGDRLSVWTLQQQKFGTSTGRVAIRIKDKTLLIVRSLNEQIISEWLLGVKMVHVSICMGNCKVLSS